MDLLRIAEIINKAELPEDVFGALFGNDAEELLRSLGRIYHRLARSTHPDNFASDKNAVKIAESVFGKLNNFKMEAEQKIREGVYGKRKAASTINSPPRITVVTKKRSYVIGNFLWQGDISNIYDCIYSEDGKDFNALFKIAQSTKESGFLANEGIILQHLFEGGEEIDEYFHRFLPRVIESFKINDIYLRR